MTNNKQKNENSSIETMVIKNNDNDFTKFTESASGGPSNLPSATESANGKSTTDLNFQETIVTDKNPDSKVTVEPTKPIKPESE